MCIVVAKGLVDVVVSRNHGGAWNRAYDGTNLSISWDALIARSLRNDLSASKLPIMEFIRHQRLKRIGQRIDVVHPTGPTKHIRRRDSEASINHQSQTKNSSWHHGLVRSSCQARERAIDGGHDQRGEICCKAEEEEASGISPQVGHEIDQEVEDKHVDGFVRQVHEVTCDRLSGLVDESIAIVLFDYRALCIDSQDLTHSLAQVSGLRILRIEMLTSS